MVAGPCVGGDPDLEAQALRRAGGDVDAVLARTQPATVLEVTVLAVGIDDAGGLAVRPSTPSTMRFFVFFVPVDDHDGPLDDRARLRVHHEVRRRQITPLRDNGAHAEAAGSA